MSAEAPNPKKSDDSSRANINPTSIDLQNWGNHLLKKLHDSYRREENCDLELILHHDTKFVRVHGSVIHVWTEYFKTQVERQGTPGRVILPETVGAAPLLAIVQFLYTGHLALNADNFDSIFCTANILGLDVVTAILRRHGHKAANISQSGINGIIETPTAVTPASRATSGSKESATFAGNKRSAPPADCYVELEGKRSRVLVEDEDPTFMKVHTGTEFLTNDEEAKYDVGKGPLKRLYNKVTKRKRFPTPTRSSRKGEEAVKQLTSSDVFKKYNDGGANASVSQTNESSSTKIIMDLIKRNPKLLRDEHPTKLKIKQMSATGQERIVIVTVCTKVDLQGRRSIQIVHSPEYDAEPIRLHGPWSCTRCLRAGGKILEFSSYQGLRTHMTKVHSVVFDPNSCEQCGEKCLDRTSLAHHQADRHGTTLTEGIGNKAASETPKMKSFSLSDLKRRRFKLKRTAVGAEPKSELERYVNQQEISTSARGQELSSAGRKMESETEFSGESKNTLSLKTKEDNIIFSLNANQAALSAANAPESSPIPTSTSHSTSTTVSRTTSTMALPTFQELRGIPPFPTMANQEPIQVVNLALPVGGDGIHDAEDMLDIDQQPSIFILSNDMDQNQYFDTLFNQQPTEFQEPSEEALAAQQLGYHLNVHPTVAHEQGTNEMNLTKGLQHSSYVQHDPTCTSSNNTPNPVPGFPQHNSQKYVG